MKSSTLVFCNIFLRPSRIQVPLLQKIQIDFLKKKSQVLKQLLLHYTKNSHTYKHYKQEINLHDMSDEDSSIVGGK